MLDPNTKMVRCFRIEFLKAYKVQRMERISVIEINESKDTPCDAPSKEGEHRSTTSVSLLRLLGNTWLGKWILMDGVCRCDNPIWLSLIKWVVSLSVSRGYPRPALLVSLLCLWPRASVRALLTPTWCPTQKHEPPERWSPLSAWVTAELKGHNVSGVWELRWGALRIGSIVLN